MPVATRCYKRHDGFFISYTRVDRAWAEWIAWQLQEAGYTVVLQAWHFDYGPSLVQAMHQASMEAERTIAVISPDYFISRFTQPEWQAAFAKDPTGEKGVLLPIRVRPCDLPGILAPRVYIDLVGLAEDVAHATLLTGVRRGGSTPTTAPPFPGAPPHTVATSPRFPGILPPIWNVPHHRNPNFTGREQLLTAMHQALTAGQPAALTQALSGLGGSGIVSTDYQYTVATTWEVAMQCVQSEQPAAGDLLYLCAFLAPADIPSNLIQDGCAHLPETLATAVADPLTFDEAIAALRRYSLLEREGGAFSVHRLVQAVTQERLGEENRAVCLSLVEHARAGLAAASMCGSVAAGRRQTARPRPLHGPR